MLLLLWLCVGVLATPSSWELIVNNEAVNLGGEYFTGTLYPGSREGAASWTAAKADVPMFFLFGGRGFTNSSAEGLLNDHWLYENSGDWTFLNDLNSYYPDIISPTDVDVDKIYGNIAGDYETDNLPSARRGAAVWTKGISSFTNMYLFGGVGVIPKLDFNSTLTERTGLLRDLWAYSTIHDSWKFMAGDFERDLHAQEYDLINNITETMPGCRRGAAAWNYRDDFFLYGGMGLSQGGRIGHVADMWRFRDADLTGDGIATWYWVAGAKVGSDTLPVKATYWDTANHPGGVAFAATWVWETYDSKDKDEKTALLYLFGGEDYRTRATTEMYVFSTYRNSWKFLRSKYGWDEDVPPARKSARVVSGELGSSTDEFVDRGYAFIFGGIGDLEYLNDLVVYCSEYNQWETIEPNQDFDYSADDAVSYPSKKKASTLWTAVAQGEFLLFGGYGWTNESAVYVGYMNDFWKYSYNREYQMEEKAEKMGWPYYVLISVFTVVGLVVAVLCIIGCIFVGFRIYQRAGEVKEDLERERSFSFGPIDDEEELLSRE